ncbi:DUF4097 family beta strand repeat-containing protein [Actinomadura oligospora]|uniref:DUF4097 family beta strand repeat-containing protein n=1 Tax=Actinomadura oligospora TaxID=111804 RepID=UPI00047EFC20|nr:DUF4097 family beta strand repeat-containing protein [Actinomadura oligospora]
MRRQLLSLGLAVTAVVTLTACDPDMDKIHRDAAALTAKVTAVRLDGIRSGSVKVVGGTAKASLTRTIHYADKRPDGPTHRIENGVLVLSGCDVSDCSISYDIKVPAGVPVSGGTTNGSITLSHVGQVNVTTHSGRVELDGVSGSVTARTHDGRISGSGLGGDSIDVQTSNGAVDLTPTKPENIRAKTSNGAITLTVPKDGRYQVTTHTSNGKRDIGVPNDPSGRHRLDLTTSNGRIEVRAA